MHRHARTALFYAAFAGLALGVACAEPVDANTNQEGGPEAFDAGRAPGDKYKKDDEHRGKRRYQSNQAKLRPWAWPLHCTPNAVVDGRFTGFDDESSWAHCLRTKCGLKEACIDEECDPHKDCIVANCPAGQLFAGPGMCDGNGHCKPGKPEPEVYCTPNHPEYPTHKDAKCVKPACSQLNPGDCRWPSIPASKKVPCDDDNACTAGDTCIFGSCTGIPGSGCDDGNACTVDFCDKFDGCQNISAADGGWCNDGDKCFAQKACKNAACSGGIAIECLDGSPCTTGKCHAQTGCYYKHKHKGTACDGMGLCGSYYGTCDDGKCAMKAYAEDSCDDGDNCTTDTCYPGKGCIHQKKAGCTP